MEPISAMAAFSLRSADHKVPPKPVPQVRAAATVEAPDSVIVTVGVKKEDLEPIQAKVRELEKKLAELKATPKPEAAGSKCDSVCQGKCGGDCGVDSCACLAAKKPVLKATPAPQPRTPVQQAPVPQDPARFSRPVGRVENGVYYEYPVDGQMPQPPIMQAPPQQQFHFAPPPMMGGFQGGGMFGGGGFFGGSGCSGSGCR